MVVVVTIAGRSMEPALHAGDFVIGVRVPHWRGLLWNAVRTLMLRRGALVLVRPPNHPQRLLIKRIDALAGEARTWRDQEQRGITAPVPANHVFVLSDTTTLQAFADSREYGPFPITALYARVVWKVQALRTED